MLLTRAMQRPNVIYKLASGGVFYTPDGEGRIWYNSVSEALANHPGEYVIHAIDIDHDEV